ncbi:ATP-dependent DNA helicase DinG [Leclercia adecarboxylata]|uniref:ATP-dependent DNA helicase DinG n=1 Tax=Leclercia adecarboxylata TaxID=83655 RepID=A0A4U9HXL1_9ENTR|nr:ATP-dependent DNA helicase DinG [Leclercia adecarboxylata]
MITVSAATARLYKDCFVVKARKTAMDADVVVVNHHLFLADMVVKEGGFGELIPRPTY